MVQLHGFDATKRTSRTAQQASIIISNGSRFPSRGYRDLAKSLKKSDSLGAAALYPLDTSELGGTKNRQAAVLRELGSDRFLHIEINGPLRHRLSTEVSLQTELFKMIGDWYRKQMM